MAIAHYSASASPSASGSLPATVALSGARGLVGAALAQSLAAQGTRVTPLVRGTPRTGEAAWDVERGLADPSAVSGIEAVVHLAGENIATGRWTAAKKRRIFDSRVDGTRHLCESLAKLAAPPKTLVCASAIGYYGHCGDAVVAEDSASGRGFLPEVCVEWERATKPAADAGIRVVQLRIGIVLSREGGALQKMLLPFQLGVGGVVGHGAQYWSWVSLPDLVGMFEHALTCRELSGPVNAVAPHAVTNREFTKTLGRVLVRPTLFPMPAFAARLALGEMADALILASTRVAPLRLQETGYAFRHPDLEGALRAVLARKGTA
ncbi:MAG: TIGR01777 family oxidoreductase [Pirellulales bacterium]